MILDVTQAWLAGGDPRAAAHQEVTELVLGGHVFEATAARLHWETLSVPPLQHVPRPTVANERPTVDEYVGIRESPSSHTSRAGYRSQQGVGGDGEVADAAAGGVEDRVGDGGCDADEHELAQALDADGVGLGVVRR